MTGKFFLRISKKCIITGDITEKPETFHVLKDITPCAKETGLDFKTFKSIGTMFNFLRQPSQINSSAQSDMG